MINDASLPFLQYLVDNQHQPGDKLPTLQEISKELGISVGKLREQLEVARFMGLVSVRPRVGIQREPFRFYPAMLNSALFGIASNEATFEHLSQFRKAVESSLWHEAVRLLTVADKQQLKGLVEAAWVKLRGRPVRVPNREHSSFHLLIFSRLENPFVKGVLEAYWQAYRASELTRYQPYSYWTTVWTYHGRIADALCDNQFERGRELLVEHFALLPQHPFEQVEEVPPINDNHPIVSPTESQLS